MQSRGSSLAGDGISVLPPGYRASDTGLTVIIGVKLASPDPPWLWFARYSAKFSGRKGLCMRLALERGVPQEERQKVALGSLTDWDAARIFLEVVRCGSFRSAAERLDLSINVVRRRIDDFERQIGATLFTRDVHGTRLTDEGSLVVSAVERMEAASFDLLRAGNSVANTLSGEVRVAVTEGLGTFWLAPRLVEFQQSFPNIHGRPALRDALGRRVAARGRHCDPSVAAGRARRQAGPARPDAFDVLCQPEIHRNLRRPEDAGRTGQASAGDAGRRSRPPPRRLSRACFPVIPSAICW